MGSALNNLQRLICHKTQQTKSHVFITWNIQTFVFIFLVKLTTFLSLGISRLLSSSSLLYSECFHHLEYSDFCLHLPCYTHNVSDDMSFTILQVFHVKFKSLHKTSNQTLYSIHTARLF